MKIFKILSIIALTVLLCCSKEDYSVSPNHIEKLHWVKFRQSSMPIILAGNSNSDIIIIKVHGGPGASSIQEFQASDWVDAFENEFLLAYWDQPFAGFSVNDNFPQIADFEVSHYRQSLETVVDYLHFIQPNKKIVFWGQSWGGLIVCDFITEPSNQNEYAGWILESALNTNGFRDYIGIRESIIEQANLKISQGETKWEQELNWINQNSYDPAFYNLELWERYEKYADELLAPLDPEPKPINFRRRNVFLRETIHRQRLMYNLMGQPFNSDLFLSDKVYRFNKDNMIDNISKKGVFIQGKFDRSVSVKSTEEFASLSSQITTFFLYNSSGHNPSFTERERFVTDVKNYLATL
jgi:pimeloyl-ACP methyl ester carboxylesterase